MPQASIPKRASTPNRPYAHTLVILALWLVFYGSFTLITPALLDDADSVHAEVAREMLLRHDWVTLYANGIRYLEKAPLLYWAMAVCMRLSQLLGHTSAAALAIAARIPLALTVLALAFAVEAFTRHIFSNVEHSPTPIEQNSPRLTQNKIGTHAGLYAALILLSSFGLFLFTRITIPDALLCLWLTLALYAYHLTEQQPFTETILANATTDRSVILSEAKNPRISPLPLSVLPNLPVPHSSQSHRDEWAPPNLRLLSYAFTACCALAVLTKGLIGLLFPIAIVATHLLLTRGPRAAIQRLRQLHPISSTAVFLAIAAPWHILIALANPTQGHPANLTYTNGHWQVPLPTDGNVHGWAWFYFINEQLLRYLNLRVPHDYDTVPLWLFLGLILIWLGPWSAFLFQTARSAIAAIVPSCQLKAPKLTARDSFFPRAETSTHLLLLLWAAIPLLFFSLSTRQEYYVLPSLPPLAILLALWLASDTIPKTRRANLRATAVLLTLGTLFAAATIYFLLHTHAPTPNTDLATLLQQNPSDYAMSMGHFLDLNANALALFRLPLALAAAALFLGPFASYLLRRRAYLESSTQYSHAATLALAAGAFTFLLAAHLGLQTFAPILSSQQLAAAIAPQLTPRPGEPAPLLVIHQEYEYASTLSFYLQQPTYIPASSSAVLTSQLGTVYSAPNPATTAPPANLASPATPTPSAASAPSAPSAPSTLPLGNPRLQPWASQRAQNTGALAPGVSLSPHPAAINPIHILTDPTHEGTLNYGRSSNLWYGSFFPDAPPIFENPQSLAQKWSTPQRVFLWQDLANQPSPLPANLTPIYVIATSGGKQILSNQPNHR
jgi:4-amino-4-deoxy-L-arabinose transferase-like glycosyltransferase